MREEAEGCVEALRVLIGPAIEGVSATGLADMRSKHDGVRRTVEELARLNVPVPETLTTLIEELRLELNLADDSRDTLEYLRRALNDVLVEIDTALPDEPSGSLDRKIAIVP